MNKDNPLLGSLYIASGVFFIAVMGACAKWLGETYHPIELVFYRNAAVLIILSLILSARNQWHILKTERIKSHGVRAAVGTIGIILGFTGLQYLPLAEAQTLAFTAPLFIVILSYPLLKEKVGPYKVTAVIIGFIGVWFIADPNGNFPLIGVGIALTATFFNALVQIHLRDLGRTENPLTTVFYFMAFGTCATALALPFVWTGPKIADAFIILLLCSAGGLQQFLKAKGHALAPVALTAPLDYTALLWAILFGFLFWGTLPTWSMMLGAFIIMGSNAVIVWREQRKKMR